MNTLSNLSDGSPDASQWEADIVHALSSNKLHHFVELFPAMQHAKNSALVKDVLETIVKTKEPHWLDVVVETEDKTTHKAHFMPTLCKLIVEHDRLDLLQRIQMVCPHWFGESRQRHANLLERICDHIAYSDRANFMSWFCAQEKLSLAQHVSIMSTAAFFNSRQVVQCLLDNSNHFDVQQYQVELKKVACNVISSSRTACMDDLLPALGGPSELLPSLDHALARRHSSSNEYKRLLEYRMALQANIDHSCLDEQLTMSKSGAPRAAPSKM